MEALATEILTKEEIIRKFPDQWVLVGNPQLDSLDTLGSIMSKLVSGVVLLHGKDKREIAQKGIEARKGYPAVTLVYTGEIPQNRKWLL